MEMKKQLKLIITATVFLLAACSGNQDATTDTEEGIESEPSITDDTRLNLDENSDLDLPSNLRTLVTFDLDWEAWHDTIDWSVVDWEDSDTMPEDPPILTPAMIREIGSLPYVDMFEYSMTAWAESKELYHYIPGLGANRWGEREFFPLRGTSVPGLFSDETTITELIQGRMFTDTEISNYTEVNPVIVPIEFANINDLSVASTFTLYVTVRMPFPDDELNLDWYDSDESIYAERSFTFEIIGIFEASEAPEVSDDPWAWSIENNIHTLISSGIHVSNVVVEEMLAFEHNTRHDMILELGLEDDPTFSLDLNAEFNPTIESIMILRYAHEIENFETAALKVLPEFWLVEDISILMTDRE